MASWRKTGRKSDFYTITSKKYYTSTFYRPKSIYSSRNMGLTEFSNRLQIFRHKFEKDIIKSDKEYFWIRTKLQVGRGEESFELTVTSKSYRKEFVKDDLKTVLREIADRQYELADRMKATGGQADYITIKEISIRTFTYESNYSTDEV